MVEVVRIEGLRIPSDVAITDPRLFVELDPDDLLDEVHENNNLAWGDFLAVPEPTMGMGLLAGIFFLAGVSRRK